MSNPEDWLVDIMAEATEKLCGFKPDIEIVEDFLISDQKQKLKLNDPRLNILYLPNQ